MRAFDRIRQMVSGGWLAALCLCMGVLPARAQLAPVTVQVEVMDSNAGKKITAKDGKADSLNVVVYLTPLAPGVSVATTSSGRAMPQIVQHNKTFEPHVLVVQVGTAVQFPNKDPFLHNVFSLFDGKQFDLGFYEAGSSKTIHFDRPGVSFLFCNIHPEMSAAVVAVDTPYFSISDESGRVSIPNVPDGRYMLNVWYERSLPQELKSLGRVVMISQGARSLEPIRITENPNFSLAHKNKYGQDYVPPANTSPVYGHP
jgi:plastocyanin